MLKRRTTKQILGGLVILFASSFVLSKDIPLTNWTVPHADYLGKQVDITEGTAFVGVTPCRIVYTPGGAPWGATQWGTPAIVQNATRDFDLNSAPHCTGIPAGVEAYSLNVTVVSPAGPGDLRMWPQGSPPASPTSVMNWSQFGAAFAIANAVIVPAGTNGGVTVQMAGTSGHLIIDLNGYFTDDGSTGSYFRWVTADPARAVYVWNTDTTGSSNGVESYISSGVDGSAALYGHTVASGTGRTYGVYGRTISESADVAGVYGLDATGLVYATGHFGAGLRGESSRNRGILGIVGDSGEDAILGRKVVTATGGLQSEGGLACTATIAACGIGGTSYSGVKAFIEPHPTDAARTIRYISLEGPEAGTYFRGRAKFQGGLAVIEVPEDFRMVTADEGLSIQVTPIGEMASVAVQEIGLNRIVVKGSRSVEFFYTVNGVRRGFEQHAAVVEEAFYVPDSPESKMPLALSAHQKAKLVANGSFNADGSVNIVTAKRLGWDKKWEKRTAPAPKSDSP